MSAHDTNLATEFLLRGYIARLEDMDALVLNNPHLLLSCLVARYTDRCHYLIAKLKWWIAKGGDRALDEASVWLPAIDSLERDILGSLDRAEKTAAYKAMIAARAA